MRNKIKKEVDLISETTENEVKIEGYLLSRPKLIFSWVLIILSLGFLKLIFYWRSDLQLRFTHNKCDLKIASK
jgi:cation-transporting ATPase 13A2